MRGPGLGETAYFGKTFVSVIRTSYKQRRSKRMRKVRLGQYPPEGGGM